MCCQENDKSSPSRHLSLPLAARIFSSTHCYPSFRGLFPFSSISLSVSRLLFTLLRRLLLPFQLPLPDISFCLSCPHFCSLVDNFFPSLSCLFPPLIFCPPLPRSHLQTSTLLCLLILLPLPPFPTLCAHNRPFSYSFFFIASTLLPSLRLFFHVFSPVCCDHSQDGDS